MLKVDGGATVNELLMQLQADILGVPVVRPVVAETTALGAAYAAGLAVGFWTDLDTLRRQWKADRQWEPRWSDDQREEAMRGWQKAVDAIRSTGSTCGETQSIRFTVAPSHRRTVAPCTDLWPISIPLFPNGSAQTLGSPTPAQARGWEHIRNGRHTLIAAPTGSGKTLAAFLTAIDDLVQEGMRAPLPDEIRVVYISPLKALSADIHKNLAEPRRGIRQLAESLGQTAPRITAAVRTGDTTQSERAAMLRTPPHILVTTPESLYLLLTAGRSRDLLRTVRTVIVDEIHAVIGTRRGAHLALSLERLQQRRRGRPGQPAQRIGLSATQQSDRGGRAFSRRRGRPPRRLRHRRRRPPARARSRSRDSPLAARRRHGARGVGGVPTTG